MKREFYNHWNIEKNHEVHNDEDRAIPGQVLSIQKLINRSMNGTIVDKFKKGTFQNEKLDVDLKKVRNMDINDKKEFVEMLDLELKKQKQQFTSELTEIQEVQRKKREEIEQQLYEKFKQKELLTKKTE